MLIHRLIAIGSVTFVKSRFTRGVFVIPQRGVHLPSRRYLVSSDDAPIQNQSVTGPIYEMPDSPSILESVREEHPHSLYAVDITDDDKEHWFSKYKYDIPVLHIDDVYWTKHRLTVEDAIAGIEESRDGRFDKRQGEPDASRLERKS
eukprot:CCRYP_010157-RA/>CCRYP_010157-RA protein AED:0.11 eAED:0.11 QI:0/0.5/0.66/1/0.5/0.66/3/1126/146